jgi:DNA-binding transcriptional regulator LsrR (DeoR family)
VLLAVAVVYCRQLLETCVQQQQQVTLMLYCVGAVAASSSSSSSINYHISVCSKALRLCSVCMHVAIQKIDAFATLHCTRHPRVLPLLLLLLLQLPCVVAVAAGMLSLQVKNHTITHATKRTPASIAVIVLCLAVVHTATKYMFALLFC